MTIFQTIILGVVEGITEFLPISSTAHLELTQVFLGIPTTSFVKSFMITIQSGAILAVVALYFRKIFSSYRYFLNICIAFIPTGIIGFLLYKIIKRFLLGNIMLALIALVLGGILILVFEKYQKKKSLAQNGSASKSVESLSAKELLSLGTIQALAVVPGVSRSGAVILGGRMLGLPSSLIAEFSFVLAIPTMLAATLYDLWKSGVDFSSADWKTLALGCVVSFVVALFSVRWLVSYVKNHTFEIFAWYRIGVGVLFILYFYFT